jgi:hypothetical protein
MTQENRWKSINPTNIISCIWGMMPVPVNIPPKKKHYKEPDEIDQSNQNKSPAVQVGRGQCLNFSKFQRTKLKKKKNSSPKNRLKSINPTTNVIHQSFPP